MKQRQAVVVRRWGDVRGRWTSVGDELVVGKRKVRERM